MADYGRDYGTGRNGWRNRGDFGMGYGSEYGGGGYRRGMSADRGQGWNNVDRQGGWGDRGRSGGSGNFDDSWRSSGLGQGQGRPSFGEGQWGERDWHGGGYRSGERGYFADQGEMDRGYYGRGPRQSGQDYDRDIGDRLRRGWNRFRDEARDWIGRGYDRGW